MRGVIFFAVGLAIGVTGGVSAGYSRWHEPFDRFADARRAIMNRAEDAPKGEILLIGDSIIHRLYLPELCGHPVFNAGMSGARADQIEPLLDPLIDKLKPRLIIMAAGTNDAVQGDEWRADLQRMKRARMVVMTPDDKLPARLLADGVHPNAEGRAELKRRFAKNCRFTPHKPGPPSP